MITINLVEFVFGMIALLLACWTLVGIWLFVKALKYVFMFIALAWVSMLFFAK
jgi:hypothetical protein